MELLAPKTAASFSGVDPKTCLAGTAVEAPPRPQASPETLPARGGSAPALQ